ncbi:DUF2169 family type VI secretion system accessory protein [Winslowiella iniecta]|uniref:Pentapeptide repeat n=1 Tax=Winslowiella iniecta TaxID=1560201 RepID=A0A0L7TAA8_9GAMM|nr:DUF2169 domain-containing protein [Winslowiella iniecta]KOC88889.1 pentapeptide repeat [Winslowiella iniecta]KOC92295.1 pentapeptide repeat [Winslowiella iniecta]
MKIIKPLRLSVLNRPFSLRGENQLGISVLALADMSATPQLRPEAELWQLAASELSASGGVLDLAMPKACAEYLATGYAFSQHQADKTRCAVKIEVGMLSKTLMVSGDRHWHNDKPSRPQAFSQMRLDWSRAFGGKGFANNPQGIGFTPDNIEGHDYYRLPNIEPLHRGIRSVRDRPEPVGFGPLDMTWPQRFSRIGKQYDANWLHHDFPGFAPDMDWRLFNAASEDQWWPENNRLPSEAAWRIWNMHPEQPLQQGRLPPWQARCFINRQSVQQPQFVEVPLRATTLWFFPHLEQMLLIWQGSIRIAEDDGADILQILPALEKTGSERSLQHYRQVLEQRLDKEKGALYAFREKDLLPEEAIGPWLDTELPVQESPVCANLRNRETHLRQQQGARLAELGQDSNQQLPLLSNATLPELHELPDFIEQLEQQADHLREQAACHSERAQRDNAASTALPSGPEALHQMQALLHRHETALSDKQRAEAIASLHQIYLMSVQAQPAAKRIEGETVQILRNRALATMALNGDFSGLDFTGADLSQLDLRGANFSRALLESVDFSHSQLDGVNFSEAVLARAEFNQASLCHAVFDHASLAFAHCKRSDFSGAHFLSTVWHETVLDNCRFDGASLSEMVVHNAVIYQSRFQQAALDNMLFLGLSLAEPDFSVASLTKVSFVQCDLDKADFAGAILTGCSLVESRAAHSNFHRACLLSCAITAESYLPGADFTLATLTECNLRQLQLDHACFHQARLVNSDLSEASCQQADMSRSNLAGSLFIRTNFRDATLADSNLIGAVLQKCQLGGADLRGANLFRTDLSQSLINDATQLTDAFICRTKTLPRRERQ